MTENYRRELLNAIDKKERELTGLRLRLSQAPIGHMTRAKSYVANKLGNPFYKRFDFEIIDSCHDETVGVLFKPYYTTLNGVTIHRTPALQTINELFNNSPYSIREIYATPKGLVVEIHEN